MHERTRFGLQAEQEVVKHLQQQGYTILAHNVRYPFGEIDIVARHKDTIAFVEVKARNKVLFPLSEVIVASKQRKIIMAAQQFCAQEKLTDIYCRFDVALITMENNKPQLTYIAHAFTQQDNF